MSISVFCSSQKRSKGCSVFKAGLFLYACIYDRPGRYQAVYAGDHDVSKEVQNGKNYLIFAEGTRSKNGNQIGSFKGGSFKAATKAKCPIVPVALIDSFKPFDTKTISQVTVQVHFLEPLYYEEYKNMKTTEIAEIVHDRIQKIIDENCPERAEIQ